MRRNRFRFKWFQDTMALSACSKTTCVVWPSVQGQEFRSSGIALYPYPSTARGYWVTSPSPLPPPPSPPLAHPKARPPTPSLARSLARSLSLSLSPPLCVCLSVCLLAWLSVWQSLSRSLPLSLSRSRMCVCVCIYIYIYTYICMYVCMHACMHACMYVCMNVCMYVYRYITETEREREREIYIYIYISGPDDMDNQADPQHNLRGDGLVVQPRHLTQPSSSSSASSSGQPAQQPSPVEGPVQTGGPPLFGMHDLDQQAAEAVQSGRASPWRVEGNGPSMRSSVRVDDNSHDISWVQGATPRTLPPPMPLLPNTVLSMRSTIMGSWRGATWSPPEGSVVQHPPRQQVEPTIVIYKTLSSHPGRDVLPNSLHLTIHPAGEWIATTRFELGFARTPRFWLVVIDHAPPVAPGQLPLRSGHSFWLEWRGVEGVWQRRPRFNNDVQTLGGFSTIPEMEAPRPPTPPQRRDPPDSQRARPSYSGGFDPQRFVDNRPLRGRLIPAEQEERPPASSTTSTRPAAKSRPPTPPRSSGSDTETSWPSEDPAPAEDDTTGLIQRVVYGNADPYDLKEQNANKDAVDFVALMQNNRPQPGAADNSAGMPNNVDQQVDPQAGNALPTQQPANHTDQWFSVAANFQGEYTVSGILQLLQKILHELLQQSFAQPNEYLTNLAYHACYYLSKLASTNERQLQPTPEGDNPNHAAALGPTAMVFCITNAFVEAEATLDSLFRNHRDLPRRHLEKELRRVENLLRDGRAVFKSWARDPNAPGALPGTAASQNALDGVSFSFLSIEEGGIASLEENLQLALAAAQRCNQYMDQLLAWIQQQFHDSNQRGSPPPKKRRTEQASSSDCPPHFVPNGGDEWRLPLSRGSDAPQDRDEVPRPPHRAVGGPAAGRRQPEPALPRRDLQGQGPEPGAAPYNILKAQQTLERVMPFTEQQIATALQEVHSLLSQWTTALWGEPIALCDSFEDDCTTTGAPPSGELAPTLPADASDQETVSIDSHRRRRMHAAFGDE